MIFSHQSSVHLSVFLVSLYLTLLTLESGFFKHSLSLPILSDHTLKQLILTCIVIATDGTQMSPRFCCSQLLSQLVNSFFVFTLPVHNC